MASHTAKHSSRVCVTTPDARSCLRGFWDRLVSQRILYFFFEEEEDEEEGERGEAKMVSLKEGQVRWGMPATALLVSVSLSGSLLVVSVLEADGAAAVDEVDVGELPLLLSDGDVLVGEAGQAPPPPPPPAPAPPNPVPEFLAQLPFNPIPNPAPNPTPKPIIIANKTRNTNMDRFKPHTLCPCPSPCPSPSAGDNFKRP